MFGQLLVALDGSECANHALDAALTLARTEGSTLTLCSVADSSALFRSRLPADLVESTSAELRAGAEKVVEAGASKARALGTNVSTCIVEGEPSFEITRRAAQEGVGAIVMGTHGRSGLRLLVMGSVTESVLRSSPVPVVAVRATARIAALDSNARVVVPIDGSECSMRALDLAAEFAATFGGELLILHVVDLAKAATLTGGQAELAVGCVEELQDEGRRIVDEAVERIAKRVRIASRIEDGSAAEVIGRVVAEVVPAYVVMGSHGRTGVSRLVIGSVAASVVRNAAVPVMV